MTVTTRFYPTFSAATFAPTNWRGAWDDTSDADPPCLLSRTKIGTPASTSAFESVGTNNWDIAWEQFVSEPFTAAVNFSVADTMQWVLGVTENNAGMNAFFHFYAYVTAGDTNTVRGTLLTDNIGATEFTTTATGRGEGTKALGSVSAQIGDRIVVEVGARCQNTVTTSFNCTLYCEGTSTDLTQGGTAVTTNPGWIEFVTAADPFGSGAYTLVAAQGSYSLSGQAVALRTTRVLAAGQGSYAVTGKPVGLIFGRKLVAGQGSYSIAGQTISLRINRVLAATYGAYSVAGQTVSLRIGRVLQGATGLYAVIGQDVALRYSGVAARVLNCATGIYQILGQAVAFARGNVWTNQPSDPDNWVPDAPDDPLWVVHPPAAPDWSEQTPTSDPWDPVNSGSNPWTPQ